ncbi:MAG TPA: stage II sporulation protein M [Baekduia sp.]|uniref:stage II sporulation protein M n=1 Tax=Baekduia sp. TaxID=2600305 RepID=UPI002BC63C81|nr:stage II sporulation protein M [Baekduia sp.]HMJ35753.1 stage II sporulation protein M [Baekduia sp.]
MTLDRFERERVDAWRRLEVALGEARGRPERLGAAGVLELGGLYRAAAADLALARRLFPGDPLTGRLEALVVRARQAVYADVGGRRSPRRFFAEGYWRLVRERRVALAVAAALFVGATAFALVWGILDPDAAAGLVPGAFIDGADPPSGDRGLTASQSAAFSSEIFTNNIQVTFLSFAAGLLFAVGGAFLLAYNGLIFGAVLGVAAANGNLDQVVRLVVAHGVLELSCIVVAGAAGLRMGWALIDPGPHTRRAALAAQARPAMAVVLGTAPWLIVAGLVEGYVSPAGWGGAGPYVVGLGLGALYWTLIVLRGRRRAPPQTAAKAASSLSSA